MLERVRDRGRDRKREIERDKDRVCKEIEYEGDTKLECMV